MPLATRPLHQAWYPTTTPEPSAQPLPIELYGERLLLWRGPTGWVASAAICPHAGADLAQGSVQDARLVCAFHGFTFDQHGTCRDMPDDQPPLAVRPARTMGETTWIWAGSGSPGWEAPSIRGPAVGWIPCGSFDRMVTASLAEIFENVVDVEHFVPVHQTARPPTIENIECEGPRLVVSMLQSFSERRPMAVRMVAYGPGWTITTFGRQPWLELRSRHLPVDQRRTNVSWTAWVRAPSSQAARAKLATAIVDRLWHELGQDDHVWTRRDPLVDRRSGEALEAVRYWLSTFAPADQ